MPTTENMARTFFLPCPRSQSSNHFDSSNGGPRKNLHQIKPLFPWTRFHSQLGKEKTHRTKGHWSTKLPFPFLIYNLRGCKKHGMYLVRPIRSSFPPSCWMECHWSLDWPRFPISFLFKALSGYRGAQWECAVGLCALCQNLFLLKVGTNLPLV